MKILRPGEACSSELACEEGQAARVPGHLQEGQPPQLGVFCSKPEGFSTLSARWILVVYHYVLKGSIISGI